MKNKQRILKFKKERIATLDFTTLRGGTNGIDNSISDCKDSIDCSQSIGTGRTSKTGSVVDCDPSFNCTETYEASICNCGSNTCP